MCWFLIHRGSDYDTLCDEVRLMRRVLSKDVSENFSAQLKLGKLSLLFQSDVLFYLWYSCS